MKKFLLPENGQFYKANLHCHSNISDGARTPEELKQEYMEQGYSIIAYTDHDVMIPHPELAEANFLPLTGYEMEVNEPGDRDMSLRRTCHMCFIALDPENTTQVCYHRTKFMPKCSEKVQHLVKFDEHAPDYERVYSAEGISDMMRIGRENGFFVTYNHPSWSQESAEQFIHYNHMNAMEIYNYSGDINHDEYVPHAYDDMIRAGKRIYCIAADDNHNRAPRDSRRYDSFGGFVMIKADRLEYKTITDALQAGNFYASQGPLIHELWIEDGALHIVCDPADKIHFSTGCRRAKSFYAEEGEMLIEAVFEVKPEDGYVRVTVEDEFGHHAMTNAYFTDEIL